MNLQAEPVLTPLQQGVYDYFKTKKKVPYQKESLQKKLGISTPAVLTKSINALIRQSLLTLEEVEGKPYLIKVEAKRTTKVHESQKKLTKVKTEKTSTSIGIEAVAPIKPSVEPTPRNAQASVATQLKEAMVITETTPMILETAEPFVHPNEDKSEVLTPQTNVVNEESISPTPEVTYNPNVPPLPTIIKHLSEDAYALIWYLLHKTEETSWDLKEIAKVHPLGKRIISAHEELYIVKIAEADITVDRFKTHLLVPRKTLKPLLGRIPFVFRPANAIKQEPKSLILSTQQQCLLHYIYQTELQTKSLTLNHKEKNLTDTGLSKLGLEQAKKSLRLYNLITIIQRGGFNYFQLTNTGKEFIQKHAEIYKQSFTPLTSQNAESMNSEPLDPYQELKSTINHLSTEQMATYRLALTYANEHPTNPSCHMNNLVGKFKLSSPEATNKALTLFQSVAKTGLIELTGKKKQHVNLTTPVKVLKTIHPDWFSNDGKKQPIETLMPIFESLNKKNKAVVSLKEIAPAKLTHQQADFKSRTYLIDTENIGTGVESSILNQLTQEDTIVFLLSQHSRGITAEQLHAFLNTSCKLESWMFEVRGKGESDLDHALVVELTLRLVAQPDTQFIVLSKDQGYLAAFRHLRSRLALKDHQLILTATF